MNMNGYACQRDDIFQIGSKYKTFVVVEEKYTRQMKMLIPYRFILPHMCRGCCYGNGLLEKGFVLVYFTCDGVRVRGVLLHIQNSTVQGGFEFLQLRG